MSAVGWWPTRRLAVRVAPGVRHRLALMLGVVALTLAGCASNPLGLSGVPRDPPPGPDRSLPWVTPPVQVPGVQRVVFESAAVGAPVSYHIYLPDEYATDTQGRYPVLYWLHGTGGGLGGIAPVAAHFASGMASGQIPPLVIVFPNGLNESMWTNSVDGRVPMETVVVRDLMNHVDANFRTVARREGRVLEGFSMGGRGAGRLGFRYPDRFGAISMLGAGPLDPDFMGPRAQTNPEERERIFREVWGRSLEVYRADGPAALAALNPASLREGVRIRIAVGAMDAMGPDNRVLHEHLTSLGIPHDFVVVPGVGHQTLQLLQGLGAEGWRFYREAVTR
jgi:enterochelin esterase-like enzyme